MNEEMHTLEALTRNCPEYLRAQNLLAERDALAQRLQALDHQIDALAAAGKLARIDRLRQALLVSTRVTPTVG